MNIDPDALGQFDDPDDEEDIHAGLPWNHHARFSGYPGMVWYATSQRVLGSQIQIGDWLDTLDHRGARCVYGMWAGEIDAGDLPEVMMRRLPQPDSPVRTVMFGFGDTETIRVDVEYDIVDPASQVTPDGTPVCGDVSP